MKHKDHYLKKIPKALAHEPGRIDELFDRMASKWAVQAERRMKPYYRQNRQLKVVN